MTVTVTRATALAAMIVVGACASDSTTTPVAIEDALPRATTTMVQVPETELPAPTTTTTTAPTTTTTAPPTTTTAAPQNDCHPSYDPCVPYTSDVDCAGGSGNGPAYTGTVRVIGPDVYDLDRDGDGVGCE
jgi:hypothetical protein